MSALNEQTKPLARSEGLVVQELSNEVLVYDLERDKAHCLNQTAALVWKHCDGKNSVSEIAQILAKESGLPVEQEVVWLALDQLGKAQLLPDKVTKMPDNLRNSRRALLKKIGLATAIALPAVTSILAPAAYAQASCVGIGAGCLPPPSPPATTCCPGLTCTAGVCK
jgi:hypothetical protein